MPKLKIHPLFIALGVLLVMTGNAVILLNTITAVIMHELAHSRVARSKGYVVSEMVLMPYGAVLSGKENISRGDGIAIYAAGPLFNGIIALIVISLWWLIPPLYNVTSLFVGVNVFLMLFNLLPVYPLDGAKIFMNMFTNKIKALNVMKILGIVLSGVLLIIFTFSAFSKIHFTAGIMAVFLFAGAVSGSEKEKYHHMAMNIPFKKNLSDGMKSENLIISENTPLVKVLKHIKPDKIVTFTIVDDNMKKIKEIEEDEMREIFENNELLTTIKSAINK